MNYVPADMAANVRSLVRRWHDLGLVSQDSAARLLEATPIEHPPKRARMRAVQQIGVLVIGWAVTGIFLTLAEHSESEDLMFKLVVLGVAVLGLGVALTLLHGSRFCQGYEEGAWLLFVTGTAAFVVLQFPDTEHPERAFSAALLGSSLVPARFGYLLGAVLAWVGFTWLLVDTLPLAYVSVIQLVLLAVLSFARDRMVWHRRGRQIGALRVACMLAVFFAWNPFAVDLFTESPPSWWTDLRYPPRDASMWLLVTVPLLYVTWGWWRRDRAALDVGLLCMTVAALILAHIATGLSVEAAMATTGLGLVVFTLIVRWRLTTGPEGVRLGLTDDARTVTIPWGWTVDDVEANEAWVSEVVSGMQSRGAGQPPQSPPTQLRE